MIDAATWTVGPSRPVEAPTSSVPIVSTSLTETVRSETRPVIARSGSCVAAITWGMPDPRAAGAMRAVSQAIAAKPAGVTISGAHHHRAASVANASPARSAAAAKASATSPMSTAPPRIAVRRRQIGAGPCPAGER